MTTKTERITILGTPAFKAFLTNAAAEECISISEFVRRRCEQPSASDCDERILRELAETLRTCIAGARKNLEKGIDDAESVLRELASGDTQNIQ